jgi:hypothetical protein
MFDWGDYLVHADRVAQRWADEAAQRSAISRAYYAVYHRASQYVRANGLVLASTKLRHQDVWRVIRSSDDLRRQDIGNRGDALKVVRIRADYDNPFPQDLEHSTRDGLLEALELMTMIDGL